ncbi:phage tail protein I [Stenotrophomonas maltophilia]|uniref:phage tail protein I n=2 Tax=Stenotrophomonas maltophilia TaxID=40324 RepID=UPI001F2D9C8E|nr:phage tail protein I [Stenotrophomonas maltophilia]MCF3488772.1 phage tail protein I [Stenotrophomonas maltophilia]
MSSASLLPPNATALERALEAADATALTMPMRHGQIKDPWTCPAEFLPWLAWEMSLDTWDSAWPEHIKRQRIASAINIQRHKGTAGSVREVIESFGGSVVIREWWQQEPRGVPHTFELVLTLSGRPGADPSAKYVEDVIAEVTRTKPVRSHFTFTQGAEFAGQVDLVGGFKVVTYRRLQMASEE